jgi:3-oxoacyl-[acyl-carrier protein] reductase
LAPDKRIVVVTGGSRGIGRALCLAFAAVDTIIYFNYTAGAAAAEQTRELVARAGGQAIGICADVAVEDQVEAFFKRITAEAGRVDVLVNNAGIARDGLIVRMKASDWDAVMNVNLKGAFFCARSAAKAMIRQRSGRIITISSIIGVTGNAGQANYAASKAGLIGLTKSLAKELASRAITVNAIAPGYIETDMTADLDPKAKQAMLAGIPLGRAGQPEEVAAAAFFLASAQAAYITGQVIHVSGGLYI